MAVCAEYTVVTRCFLLLSCSPVSCVSLPESQHRQLPRNTAGQHILETGGCRKAICSCCSSAALLSKDNKWHKTAKQVCREQKARYFPSGREHGSRCFASPTPQLLLAIADQSVECCFVPLRGHMPLPPSSLPVIPFLELPKVQQIARWEHIHPPPRTEQSSPPGLSPPQGPVDASVFRRHVDLGVVCDRGWEVGTGRRKSSTAVVEGSPTRGLAHGD